MVVTVKKNTILLVVLLSFLATDSASAWFWEKRDVKAPEITREVKKNSSKADQEKGIVAGIRATGRDIKKFFKGLGKDVKKTSQKVPGATKKEARAVGKSLKKTGKEIARESRKLPGVFKKSGVEIGASFRKLGKDIKEGSKKALEE